MTDDNRAFTPREKTIANDWRLPHPRSLKPVDGAKFPAQLLFDKKNNGDICIKVNDGVFQQGKSNAHKEVTLNFYQRGLIFEALLEAANNPNFESKNIQIKERAFVHSGGTSRMSDNPIVKLALVVNKDEEGIINIGYSKGDYRVMFQMLGPNESTIIVRKNGETVEDKALTSRCYVRTWVKFHQRLLDQWEVEGFKPHEPKGGGNYNRNNNSGGGNSGGGSNSASGGFDDVFDDIDF